MNILPFLAQSIECFMGISRNIIAHKRFTKSLPCRQEGRFECQAEGLFPSAFGRA
jgi:hypothetical protein